MLRMIREMYQSDCKFKTTVMWRDVYIIVITGMYLIVYWLLQVMTVIMALPLIFLIMIHGK